MKLNLNKRSLLNIDVIVLDGAAQDILLGTNFLGKYKVNLCLDQHLLKLPHENYYNCIPIQCARFLKIPNKKLHQYSKQLDALQEKRHQYHQIQ